MSAVQSLIVVILFVVSNAKYITNSELGCNDDVYWNFGNSTKTVINLNNNSYSNNHLCRNLCNKDINCHGWGINTYNNSECNLFKLNNDTTCIYNCESNDNTLYYGEIKTCLRNNSLQFTSIIGVNDDERITNKFVYNQSSKCFNQSKTSGLFCVDMIFF